MMTLQDTTQTKEPVCSIWVPADKKVDTQGCEFGYGWLSGKISLGVIFSFETETGKINLTGYPWKSFQEDLESQPYKPEVIDFIKEHLDEISKFLKEGYLNFYFDGARWTS